MDIVLIDIHISIYYKSLDDLIYAVIINLSNASYVFFKYDSIFINT